MKLNEKLHLVVPVYADADAADPQHYVHSAPISREIFEANFLLLSKTFTAIHAEGLGEIGGPRVACLVMREVAKRMRDEERCQALMNEIRRLTNVLTRDGARWVMMPFQDAMDRKIIDGDDLSEVENAIVFFTVLTVMHPRRTLATYLNGAVSLWGAQTSPLDCSAFGASLPISTATDNTGATPIPASSVPH